MTRNQAARVVTRIACPPTLRSNREYSIPNGRCHELTVGREPSVSMSATEGTIEEYVRWIWPSFASQSACPLWPPDVFAVCASVLAKSGAYSVAVQEWPPKGFHTTHKKWLKEIRRVSKLYQRSTDGPLVPSEKIAVTVPTWPLRAALRTQAGPVCARVVLG
jgi:hypothetical protein